MTPMTRGWGGGLGGGGGGGGGGRGGAALISSWAYFVVEVYVSEDRESV